MRHCKFPVLHTTAWVTQTDTHETIKSEKNNPWCWPTYVFTFMSYSVG